MQELESKDFSAVVSVVHKAGAVLLSLWPGNTDSVKADPLSIQQKSDGSLVSAADMRSNELLTNRLQELFPNDLIFSEEVTCDPSSVLASRRTWIIDPLDGTSAFLEGRDDFSVLVGLSVEHVAYAGIMFFPARQQTVTALRGQGAYLNGAAISVSQVDTPRERHVYIRRFESRSPHLESEMMDSGLALAKVACGELDGAIIKMVTHREWDIAAPMAILAEAGATVSDERGEAIPLGTGQVEFQYFVASNGRIHDQLLALIP